MRNRLVFAYESARDDDDLIEDVKDFLDAASEGEWEVMAWGVPNATVVVANAPLECRTMHMEPSLEMEFIPLSAAINEMDDRSNEWIEPIPTDEESSLGLAQKMVKSWMDGMFDEDNVERAAPEKVVEAPKRRSTRKRSAPVDKPVNKRRVSSAPTAEAENDDTPAPRRGRSEKVRRGGSSKESATVPTEEGEDPKREAVPMEDRGSADSLLAKFGLTGSLKGSEAFGEMFVFGDESPSNGD